MYLLLLLTCQGQEGTSVLIVGLDPAGGMSHSSALLGLAQHRRIYSMVGSPPGIKEVSSSYSARLSHQGE